LLNGTLAGYPVLGRTAVVVCAVALVISFWGPLPTPAICSVVPRVCTEFFSSTAAFSGVVVSERDWSSPSEPDSIERTYYKLKVENFYRGPSEEFIEVYTENDSGRLTLDVGHEYLLFARASAGKLQIWCGGTSAELKDAPERSARLSASWRE